MSIVFPAKSNFMFLVILHKPNYIEFAERKLTFNYLLKVINDFELHGQLQSFVWIVFYCINS